MVAEFRRDLYRGAAAAYDEFRPGYPVAMIDHLAAQSDPGQVLDLACGTGQIAFALVATANEVYAVDQEPDMVAFVVRKANAQRVRNLHRVVARAEDFAARPDTFDLVTIGNAFHRLQRRTVATNLSGLLRPGGRLALAWSADPWTGSASWQHVMADVVEQWRDDLNVRDRVPTAWKQTIEAEPNDAVLVAAGYEPLGRYEFPATAEWTVSSLVGFARSMSVFAADVNEPVAARLEAQLQARMTQAGHDGPFRQTTTAAYELYRRP